MALFHTTVLDNQIKALPTVDTASGSIATFDTDMTENLIEVKCQIVAQQSGSVTPSPSNPRPITTYSALNLVHFGEQLFNFYNYPATINANGITWTCTSNGLIKAEGTATARSQIYVRLTQEQASAFNGKYFTNLIPSNMSCAIEQDGSPYTVFATNNSVIDTITANVTVYFRVESGQSVNCVFLPTIVDTASDIAINNIPFGQTVAQGLLNVGTGKLRVTHKVVELDENWYWFKGGTQPTGKTVITTTNFPSHISDDEFSSHFAKANTAYIVQMVYGDFMLSATGTTGYFCYKNSDDGTAEEFKQYIVTQRNNGTPIQVYYKLDTPIEIQLDSITLQALLNENNIWCDTGDTEVKYLLTVGKKIA